MEVTLYSVTSFFVNLLCRIDNFSTVRELTLILEFAILKCSYTRRL
jgi:hypothetical protein